VSRRLAVVGTLLVDTIHRPDGEIVESLGGIAYSVACLVAQVSPGVCIEPICRVGSDRWDELRSTWERLPCVDPSSLIHDTSATPRNTLVYGGRESGGGVAEEGGAAVVGVGDRSECPTGLLAPLTEQDLAPAAGADLALVNCITGRDVALSALRGLSVVCERIYLDVHSLALGFAGDGTRTYRQPPDGKSWMACADVVQLNQAEAATLAGFDAFDHDPAAVNEFLQRQLTQAIERHPARPSVVVLTEGAKGATLLWHRGGAVDRIQVPAPSIEVVDPTGAGDAFGSGYALAWLLGADPPAAAVQGTRAGAAACTVSGIAEPARLREAVETQRG